MHLRRILILLTGLSLLVAGPAYAAAWSSSGRDAMWFHRGYVIHNNMWNASGYDVRQTIYANSHKDWWVTATADNRTGDGAVKTYPNVHKDWHNWDNGWEPRLSSFRTIKSTFAARSPHVGIYNVGYDIWLNGVPGNREIMIWTENYRQVPSGSVVAKGLTWSGRTWKVYATRDNRYIAFVPNKPILKGTMRIKSMLSWLRKKGRIPARSTLGQICFGVEVVSTGGKPATFKFTDFSVSTTRR